MYFTVNGKEHNLKRLKGKTVTEFAKNLESLGYPSEFHNEEMRDRARSVEKRYGNTQWKRGSFTKADTQNIAKNMGALTRDEAMKRMAARRGITVPDSREYGSTNYYQPGGADKMVARMRKEAKRRRKITVY